MHEIRRSGWRMAMAAAGLTLSMASAQAEIRFGKADCPVPADASFKVLGAEGELDGVASEYAWLRRNRPGWRRDMQALMEKDGRKYDVLSISKGKARQKICFDISDFFGKGFGDLKTP
jgi:hypothetical protein